MKRLLGLLFVLGVFAAAVSRGLTALAVFSAVLALALLVSELWAYLCLRGLTYHRTLPRDHVAIGEQVVIELEFVNAKPLPLAWLLARDRLSNGLAAAEAQSGAVTGEWLTSLLSLRWYERVVRRVPLVCATRGVYTIGPTELSSGDIFGYRRVQRVQLETTQLIAFPRVFRPEQLALAAGIPQGENRFERKLGPDPLRFAQLRPYRPGDSPRHIHWRATARTGTLQSQEFEPSAALTAIVALDVQTMARAYDHAPAMLEYAISAAASLALAALEARWQVGLAVNGPAADGSPWQYLEPSRHPRQATELLTALAALTPYRGDPFELMLGALQARLPVGASLIGVTALPRPAILDTLRALRRAHHPACLYVIGDELPADDDLEIIALGGADAWERLQTLAVV